MSLLFIFDVIFDKFIKSASLNLNDLVLNKDDLLDDFKNPVFSILFPSVICVKALESFDSDIDYNFLLSIMNYLFC